MKKIIAIISATIISLVAFASAQGEKTSSCKIEGIPGAYVTARTGEVTGDGYLHVYVNSYGVSNAGVTVEVAFTKDPNGENVQTEEKMCYVSNGSGEAKIYVGKGGVFRARWIKVYNAVCR